jgi:hypothetical protein
VPAIPPRVEQEPEEAPDPNRDGDEQNDPSLPVLLPRRRLMEVQELAEDGEKRHCRQDRQQDGDEVPRHQKTTSPTWLSSDGISHQGRFSLVLQPGANGV